MKAIVLAGGKGTRLRPLTYKIPKPLISLSDDRTLTEHIFDILKKHGIKDIILGVGYMHDKIKRYFKDGEKFGVNINYTIEKEPYGTAGPLIILKKNNKIIKEDFVMLNGDNLFNLNLKKMINLHKKNKAVATIALTKVKDTAAYGVAKLDSQNKILEFIEKPKKNSSKWINSGYYVFNPKIFDYLPKKKFVMLEKDIFPVLAEKGKLFGYKDNGQWFDTGTFELYEKVKKEWKLK